MVDTSNAALALVKLWTDSGRRLAVIAGLGAALVSLIADCPLWVASSRGAGTTLALAMLVHWIARLLTWSAAGDREEALLSAARVRERADGDKKERR
jgi:hypothetical protein